MALPAETRFGKFARAGRSAGVIGRISGPVAVMGYSSAVKSKVNVKAAWAQRAVVSRVIRRVAVASTVTLRRFRHDDRDHRHGRARIGHRPPARLGRGDPTD